MRRAAAVVLIAVVSALGPSPCDGAQLVRSWSLPAAPWGSPGRPFGIGIGPDLSVYVTDLESNHVFRFTRAGDPILDWDLGHATPRCVAVGDDGRVFVTDWEGTWGGRVLVFSEQGQLLSTFEPISPGDLFDPLGLDVDLNGNIYVVNSHIVGIQKYTASGTYLGSIRQGVTPFDVTVDPAGNVYFTDEWDGRPGIYKYGPGGELLASWGAYGSGPGQFKRPAGICRTADGRVLVVDSGNSRVQEFTDEGAFLSMWSTETLPDQGWVEIAVNPFGDVYIVDRLNNRILQYTQPPTPALRETWGKLKARFR